MFAEPPGEAQRIARDVDAMAAVVQCKHSPVYIFSIWAFGAILFLQSIQFSGSAQCFLSHFRPSKRCSSAAFIQLLESHAFDGCRFIFICYFIQYKLQAIITIQHDFSFRSTNSFFFNEKKFHCRVGRFLLRWPFRSILQCVTANMFCVNCILCSVPMQLSDCVNGVAYFKWLKFTKWIFYHYYYALLRWITVHQV